MYLKENGNAFVRTKYAITLRHEKNKWKVVQLNKHKAALCVYGHFPKNSSGDDICAEVEIKNESALLINYPVRRGISRLAKVDITQGDILSLQNKVMASDGRRKKRDKDFEKSKWNKPILEILLGGNTSSDTPISPDKNIKGWSVVEDNRKAFAMKNVVIRCNTGSGSHKETIGYNPKKKKPYSSFLYSHSTLGKAAKSACLLNI